MKRGRPWEPIWPRLLAQLDTPGIDPQTIPLLASIPFKEWPLEACHGWYWTGKVSLAPMVGSNYYPRWWRARTPMIRHNGKRRAVSTVLWELLVGPLPMGTRLAPFFPDQVAKRNVSPKYRELQHLYVGT